MSPPSPADPSRPSVLVLTASYGEGHNAAARAVAAAVAAAAGAGVARVVDVMALATPRLNSVVRSVYFSAINRTPRLWGCLYRWLDRNETVPRRLCLMPAALHRLEAILAAERPVAVCSTYPAYSVMLDHLAKKGRFSAPHFTIVTDSISINSLWWRAPSTGWFLPNEESADVLRGAGVDPARLHVHGFPVPSFFGDHAATLAPPDLAAGAAPRVLYVVHSGTHNAEMTARLLLAEPGWEVTCTVGRNERLRRELSALVVGRERPAEILGWTDRIPHLLMTHHALVSKAGGATTQEAIAALCPMIVNQVVPGQEEGNYELLRRRGAGALAQTPDVVISALRRAFAWRGAIWKQWRRALEPLARPSAARDIAAHVLEHAQMARTLSR